jgi:hypothetical protein
MKTIVDTNLAQVEHNWFDGNSYHEVIGMKFERFSTVGKAQSRSICGGRIADFKRQSIGRAGS